jgi:hypothetical protein
MMACSEDGAIETFGPGAARHSVAYDSMNDTWLVHLTSSPPLKEMLLSMFMIVLKNPGSRLSQIASKLGIEIRKVKNLQSEAMMHGFVRCRRADDMMDIELYPTFKLRSYLYRVVRERWIYDYDVVDEEGMFHGWDEVF